MTLNWCHYQLHHSYTIAGMINLGNRRMLHCWSTMYIGILEHYCNYGIIMWPFEDNFVWDRFFTASHGVNEF